MNTKKKKKDDSDPLKAPIEVQGAHVFYKYGDLLIRSQLDCVHPDLPKKVFDLKSRATHAIRYNMERFREATGYQILKIVGDLNSYEREYFDMIKSTLIKYCFQARLGNMDGIFITYHNILKIFGFEYLPLAELEKAIFETRKMADTCFNATMALFQIALNEILNEFKETENIILLINVDSKLCEITFFAQPVDEKYIVTTKKQAGLELKLNMERLINGRNVVGPMLLDDSDNFKLYYSFKKSLKTKFSAGLNLYQYFISEEASKKWWKSHLKD